MKKIKYFGLIIFLILSCEIDEKKIIGKKFDIHNLPYGRNSGIFGYKYKNETHYFVYTVYHKGKALVYILDNGLIIDFYFSNLYEYEELQKIPIGTDYSYVVKTFGEPVFLVYPDKSERYTTDWNDIFWCVYLKRKYELTEFGYILSQYNTYLSFDKDNKLQFVAEGLETDGGTIPIIE